MRRGGLGDTLLMLPLLRCLRRAHPGAGLHFAGVPEFAEPFADHGIVDAVHSVEDFALWLPAKAREQLASFDRVLGDAPEVVDVPIDPLALLPDVPAGLQLARQVGLEPRWPEDGWLLPPQQAPAGGSAIVLAPGSGNPSKCWPQRRWLELAHSLAPASLICVVGPTEIEGDDPRAWSWPDRLRFVAHRSVVELARSMRGARAYVGNDSGTTHLAALLGLPTIALFGPTDAAVWAPVGPHVRVLEGTGGELDCIAVREVEAHLAAVSGWPGATSG